MGLEIAFDGFTAGFIWEEGSERVPVWLTSGEGICVRNNTKLSEI